MDIEVFIIKILIRPAIWDKRLKEHSNRNVVDACWKKIASEMDMDESVLRKKWKYLRDQFSAESNKIKPPRSGDGAESTNEPKWPFYKALLFLKYIVKPRSSSGNLKAKEKKIAIAVDDDKEDYNNSENNDGDNDILQDNVMTETGHISEIEDNDQADTSDSTNAETIPRPTVPATPHMNPTNRADDFERPTPKRKRVPTNAKYNDKIIELERQKLNAIQNVVNREPESDDLLFFKSLLPYVSKIPTESKMRFRCRIQEVVDEFAFTPRFQLPAPRTTSNAGYLQNLQGSSYPQPSQPSPETSNASYPSPSPENSNNSIDGLLQLRNNEYYNNMNTFHQGVHHVVNMYCILLFLIKRSIYIMREDWLTSFLNNIF